MNPERDLFCIFYHSRELLPADPAAAGPQLVDIFRSATANNARDSVTGVLMFGYGSFAQVLEGPRHAVSRIFDEILKDDRHRDVTILHMGRIERRSFADWALIQVPQWDTSERTQAILAHLGPPDPRHPSTGTILNFVLNMLLTRAGRPAVLPGATPQAEEALL
jgi:hypothetical protein